MATSVVSLPGASDTLNKVWKNDKSNFGLRMLQKMGWTEGKGLGKNEDGIAENVKVAKKSNNLGLGATLDSTGSAGWNSTAMNFNSLLEGLTKAYGTVQSRVTDSSKKGKKVKNEKKTKKKRKSGSTSGENDECEDKAKAAGDRSREGGNGGNSEDDADMGAVTSTKAAFACPSRARRVKSKDVKSFSAADLRAILGKSAMPELPSNPMNGSLEGVELKSRKREKKRQREDARKAERTPESPTSSDDSTDVGSTPPDKSPPFTTGDVSAVVMETTPSANESRKKKKKRRDQARRQCEAGEETTVRPDQIDETGAQAEASVWEGSREKRRAKEVKSKGAGKKRERSKVVVEEKGETKRSKKRRGRE